MKFLVNFTCDMGVSWGGKLALEAGGVPHQHTMSSRSVKEGLGSSHSEILHQYHD